MKKFLTFISAAIAAAVIAILFAACSANYAGTYKFDSMKMDMGGAIIEVKAGEPFNGVTITEDYVVLEIKDDETWVMTTNMGSQGATEEGTWTTNSEGIVLKASDGSEIVGKLSGKILTLSENEEGMSMTINLKK